MANIIPASATQNLWKKSFNLKKNSPHIFFVGGVAGVIVSTVLACRATIKLPDILEGFEEDIKNVKGMGDEAKEKGNHDYLDREYHLDMAYVYGRGTVSIVRLYAPAAILGAVSIGALTNSHVIMHRRNQTLTAALTLITQAFDEYRGRVREELGEEAERKVYLGIIDAELDDEKGDKHAIQLADPNARSPYARFFDEASPAWEKSPELNRLFVQCQQNYANQLLQARGHMFLNEVYDMLGIERSQAGAVVGWTIGEEGDNFIDFGMFEVINRDFVNGIERSILLDFNVDGVIYDKI